MAMNNGNMKPTSDLSPVGNTFTSLQDNVMSPANANGVMAPTRPLVGVPDPTSNLILAINQRLSVVEGSVQDVQTTVAKQEGVPEQVTGVSAVESPYKTASGQIVSLVAVDFTPVPGDPNFSEVEIYFTGYNGSAEPQLIADGTTSPVQFLCETTHEVVTVTVVAVSASGVRADFSKAPTTTVALDGVASAPPAPSIAQAQVPLVNNSGWQFSFNVLGGYEFDLIAGYRIYHSTTTTTPVPPANQYTYIAQPTTNVGTITVQEVTSQIMYYWVSAVNVAGLESILTPVPFVIVDPGAPPPSLTPVTTTVSYRPVTSLNGWGNNAHYGNYEAGGGLGTEVWTLNNAPTLAYTSDTSAYDGNEGSYADCAFAHTHQYAGCIWSFSGFTPLPSTTTVNSAVLNIMTEVRQTSGPVHGHADIWYTLNNGTTWTKIYSSYSTRFKQYDTVNLSASQDFTQIQVMAFLDSHDDIEHLVYEIRLDINQTGYAGPDKVSGVTAYLSSGDVQVSWNALLPLTRTDVTAYYVYRALHGSGYALSHLHATVTPTGVSTYSWVDTTAHDDTYDYYVIAQNSSGYSPPSDPATVPANLDNTPDGTTFRRLLYVSSNGTLSTSTALNYQGNIIPSQPFGFSYATAPTSVTVSWSTTSLLRADGSTYTVTGGSQSYTGLTVGTGYYLYPYVLISTGAVQFITAPSGTPSTTYMIQASFDGRLPLGVLNFTTPTSGTGGGTGGNQGTCPEASELVDVQGKGQIRADQVKIGDMIKGYSFTQKADVYRRVLLVNSQCLSSWRVVEGHKVTPIETVWINNTWTPAYLASSTVDTTMSRTIQISVEADGDGEHNYYLVSGTQLLIHNLILAC